MLCSSFRTSTVLGGLVLGLVFPGALSVGAVDSSAMPFSRYEEIMDRNPFGPPPPKEPEPVPEGAVAAEPESVPELPEVMPENLSKIKVTLLSRYRGSLAVGFLDGTDGKSYYLQEGQSFDDFTCEAISLEDGTVRLSRGGHSADFPLWVNPSTTNCADVTTFGQPDGQPVPVATLTQWEAEQKEAAEKAAEKKAKEELAEERRKRREEWEERRREREREMAALTPEQRERRMHDMNVEIIKSGKGPPLPIELDDEDLAKLRDAGFDVPDTADGGEAGSPPRRRRRSAPPSAPSSAGGPAQP